MMATLTRTARSLRNTLASIATPCSVRTQGLGADPRALSVTITRATLAPGGLRLAFNGVAGKSYTLQYRDSLHEGNWLVWAAVMPPAATREVELTIKLMPGVPARYFRVVMTGP